MDGFQDKRYTSAEERVVMDRVIEKSKERYNNKAGENLTIKDYKIAIISLEEAINDYEQAKVPGFKKVTGEQLAYRINELGKEMHKKMKNLDDDLQSISVSLHGEEISSNKLWVRPEVKTHTSKVMMEIGNSLGWERLRLGKLVDHVNLEDSKYDLMLAKLKRLEDWNQKLDKAIEDFNQAKEFGKAIDKSILIDLLRNPKLKEGLSISNTGDGKDIQVTYKWVTKEIYNRREENIAFAEKIRDKVGATREEVKKAEAGLEKSLEDYKQAEFGNLIAADLEFTELERIVKRYAKQYLKTYRLQLGSIDFVTEDLGLEHFIPENRHYIGITDPQNINMPTALVKAYIRHRHPYAPAASPAKVQQYIEELESKYTKFSPSQGNLKMEDILIGKEALAKWQEYEEIYGRLVDDVVNISFFDYENFGIGEIGYLERKIDHAISDIDRLRNMAQDADEWMKLDLDRFPIASEEINDWINILIPTESLDLMENFLINLKVLGTKSQVEITQETIEGFDNLIESLFVEPNDGIPSVIKETLQKYSLLRDHMEK